MSDLRAVVRTILDARRSVPAPRSVLAAITGIDGCGKGYATARIVRALGAREMRVAVINVDGWLNLPHERFDASNPAEHFYRHAIRFDEMFTRLIFPLRDRRSVRLEADHADETMWVECSFDTALDRAIARAQEGLPPEETVRAYRTIFFPAQEIHFRRDNPKAAATMIVNNDPMLGPVDWSSDGG